MASSELSLAQAIKDLRDELYEAQQYHGADAGNTLRFEIVDIDLELQLVASTSLKAGGKIGWSVLGAEASAGGDRSSTRTHKLSMKLRVGAQPDGSPMQINDSGEPDQFGSG